MKNSSEACCWKHIYSLCRSFVGCPKTKFYAEVDAFGDLVSTGTIAVNSSDPATTFTGLTAQVTALTAQLAVSRLIENSVTQKKYNTLVRKWNAAFPSNKVALKK